MGIRMYEQEPAVASETSVEAALNSRCSSDSDRDSTVGHWGMYDEDQPVPSEVIQALERGIQIARFTYFPLDANFDERPVVLGMSNEAAGLDREWLHIESGMQQQAFHLVCAALGVGTCIYNLGTEGKSLNANLWGNVRMGIKMMRPTYDGSFWTTKAPEDWLPDPSLPEPRRDGGIPLVKAVEDMAISVDGRNAELRDVSQLLWAARGRTPHLYGGKRWGLTIPTWGGSQSIASLYAVTGDGAFRYVNWREDRPTHALQRISDLSEGLDAGEHARIVMAVDEETGRALWEVGYMLENLLAQAISLGVRCQAALLDPTTAAPYERSGIARAVALLSVSGDYSQETQR